MRFMVDAQLPPALASLGEEAIHVLDVGLLDASDSVIWEFALENNWVIITKDDDFQFRASVTSQPPQIIWVRVGNCTKQRLIEIFNMHWQAIKDELDAGVLLVEVI